MSIRAEYLAQKVAELSVLPRFPYDQDARLMILRTLSEMVKDEEALDWLIRRAVNLWGKWEGIRELRAIYCSRYYPGDGIETTSAIYTDGVPPDPALPRLALPAGKFEGWPKEELDAIGKAWAARNKLSPAEQRRERMHKFLTDWPGSGGVIVLDSHYDDALVGVVVAANDWTGPSHAVYDLEALEECMQEQNELHPDQPPQGIGNLMSDVLLLFRPSGEQLRPGMAPAPITQEQIDQALTVARAKRDGWTPERLAEVEAEVRRREKQANEHD